MLASTISQLPSGSISQMRSRKFGWMLADETRAGSQSRQPGVRGRGRGRGRFRVGVRVGVRVRV